MKIAASLVIVALAACAAMPLVVTPYAENVSKLSLDSNTRGAELADAYIAARTARANVVIATRLIEKNPADADLYLMLASNERIIGMNREAVAAYEDALRVHPRQEIYFDLGTLQLEMGERSAAIENLARAVRFDPAMAEEIADPATRSAVEQRVAAMP